MQPSPLPHHPTFITSLPSSSAIITREDLIEITNFLFAWKNFLSKKTKLNALHRSLHRDRHIAYFKAILLKGLPTGYDQADPNRLTLAHFSSSGLDLFGELNDETKARCIAWVYGLQRRRVNEDDIGGFRGGTFAGSSFSEVKRGVSIFFCGMIAEKQKKSKMHFFLLFFETQLCTTRLCFVLL